MSNTMSDNMMLKEIYEEPAVFEHLVKKYIKEGRVQECFPVEFNEVKFVASGSSYNCARLGQKFFENIAKLKTSFEYSSLLHLKGNLRHLVLIS